MKVVIDIPVEVFIAAKQGFIKSGGIIAQNLINAVACGTELEEVKKDERVPSNAMDTN